MAILSIRNLTTKLKIAQEEIAVVDNLSFDLNSGETLEVLSTDPGSILDFESFCKATGNVLMEQSENGGVFQFLIQKGA
mgnify:CR=1 FL=1